MTSPRPEKVAVVDEISSKLTEADAAVLTEYRGLGVGDLAELRGALRPSGTEYKVYKNSLARRAVEAAGHEDLLPLLEGPVAIAFVRGDAAVAAKALNGFAKDHEALVLKGGLLGDRFLTAEDVVALSKIAPREELLARLAGGFKAPMTKAAGLFGVFTRNFAYGLKAYADQRAATEGVPEPEPEPEAPAAESTDAPAEAATQADAPAAEADAASGDAGEPESTETEEAPAEPGEAETTETETDTGE